MFKNFHNSLNSLRISRPIQFTSASYRPTYFLTFKTRLHHIT